MVEQTHYTTWCKNLDHHITNTLCESLKTYISETAMNFSDSYHSISHPQPKTSHGVRSAHPLQPHITCINGINGGGQGQEMG